MTKSYQQKLNGEFYLFLQGRLSKSKRVIVNFIECIESIFKMCADHEQITNTGKSTWDDFHYPL